MEIYIKPVGPIGTNCYIISEEGGGCAMVDPGAQPEKLIGFLDAKGLKPEYILLTHGHYDHIGYLPEIIQQCPDTPIYATSTTKKLGHYLIMDNLNISENISLEQKNSIELNSINAIERIHPLNFLKPIQIASFILFTILSKPSGIIYLGCLA